MYIRTNSLSIYQYINFNNRLTLLMDYIGKYQINNKCQIHMFFILYAMNNAVIYKIMRKVMRDVLIYLFYITKCIILKLLVI